MLSVVHFSIENSLYMCAIFYDVQIDYIAFKQNWIRCAMKNAVLHNMNSNKKKCISSATNYLNHFMA